MQKRNYSCFLVIFMCIAVIKMDRNEQFTSYEVDDIIRSAEKLKKNNDTSKGIGRGSIIENEMKNVRILIFGNAEFRAALSDKERLWENATIPFEISRDYEKEKRDFIFDAIEEFHNKTCLRFVPRKNESSYIFIEPGMGCSAVIGNIQRKNTITLNKRCFVKGTVLHEIMHALGFIHEQNRPDRDDFVRIMFDNIIEGAEANFKKHSPDKVTSFNQSYDYGSLMHYGAFDFAKNKSKPVIIPLQEGVEIGQREGFSENDLIKINLLYDCAENNNTTTENKENANNTTTESQVNANNTTTKIEENSSTGTKAPEEKKTTPMVTQEEDQDYKIYKKIINYPWFYFFPMFY